LVGLDAAATVIAINDDYADGRDMSWLWDVPFSHALHGKTGFLVTSGSRASDMALRLLYDGIATDLIEPELDRAVQQAASHVKVGDTVAIFATYTAMWALHGRLAA
jgi:UDP-N-acetylmuramyl tripeptide synthase